MSKIILYINTIIKLGLWNVAYVVWYKFTLISSIKQYWFPVKNIESNLDYFFPCDLRSPYPEEWKKSLLEDANKILNGKIKYYGYHWKELGSPPCWNLNPFNGREYPSSQLHWTKLADFNSKIGDIKGIWEASRFDWLTTLARAYSITENAKYINTLNAWLKDWTKCNPLNIGPNWKCGQEASIRLINLVNTYLILNQENNPTKELTNLIYWHLERISANILYSIAQDNNHGTSESAALFIGGTFLENIDPLRYPKAKYYARKGRKWIEDRTHKLIEEDGSFSQHSVNYHRLLLDTLSFIEFWREKLIQPKFSHSFYKKAQAATNWLFHMTDSTSGHAVNLGANDGALLNNFNSSDYRDFRPSIQMGGALFLKTNFFEHGHWNEFLWWLDVKVNESDILSKPQSKLFKSGYVRINADQSWGLIRFPYFKFRPSHNDVFHFDLWYKGENILCDAGSYSYNPPIKERTIDLKSVKHHNTVCFDDNEQMPKLSRFLLGKWLKVHTVGEIKTNSNGSISWEGSYFDNYKNRHQRKIVAENNTWIIEDTLEGNFNHAIIGFNLNTLDCVLDKNNLSSPFGVFILPKHTVSFVNETYISEYYFQKRKITRLNIKVSKPGKYKTTIILN